MDTQQYLKGKPFESFTGDANTIIPLSIHGTLQLHLQPQADGHQSLHSPSNSQTTPQHRQHQDTWQLWDTLPWTARLLMHVPVLRTRAAWRGGRTVWAAEGQGVPAWHQPLVQQSTHSTSARRMQQLGCRGNSTQAADSAPRVSIPQMTKKALQLMFVFWALQPHSLLC